MICSSGIWGLSTECGMRRWNVGFHVCLVSLRACRIDNNSDIHLGLGPVINFSLEVWRHGKTSGSIIPIDWRYRSIWTILSARPFFSLVGFRFRVESRESPISHSQAAFYNNVVLVVLGWPAMPSISFRRWTVIAHINRLAVAAETCDSRSQIAHSYLYLHRVWTTFSTWLNVT